MTEIIMQAEALSSLPQLCDGTKAIILCDDKTKEIAGNKALKILGDCAKLHSLGSRPSPSIALCEILANEYKNADIFIAVGSGTINDIAKYTSYLLDRPYICVATAASMNGYVSPTASLISDGHKKSFAAKAPIALIADLKIIATAPLKMTRAGIGDTLCRSTIEADMILANENNGTEYNSQWFEELEAIEKRMLQHENDIQNEEFIELLMESLIIGGRMMASHGSSAPCSQGEHIIIHTYESLYGIEEEILHGEAVSVATVSMAKLQQEMMCEMPDISARIRQRSLPVDVLETALIKFGCPTKCTQLGWRESDYEHAISVAHKTRDRFTFLDIAAAR